MPSIGRRSSPGTMKILRLLAWYLVFSSAMLCHAFVHPTVLLPSTRPPCAVPSAAPSHPRSCRGEIISPSDRSPFLALDSALSYSSLSVGPSTRGRLERRRITRHYLSPSDLAGTLFATTGSVPVPLAFGLNAVLFALLRDKLLTMLTPAGFAHSLALGTGLWATLGWRGWSTCVLYLFLGQAVTKVKFSDKEARGLAEKRGGRRGPENVWGSAATALLCATACAAQWSPAPLWGGGLGSDSVVVVGPELLLLGFVASLATKLADTFASEIGKAYGKTCFLITTLERAEPGTEGAVSLEGTAAAVVGGLALSLYGYAIGLLQTPGAVAVSTSAAFVATNVESVLGATLQEKKGLEWVSNEVINFFNTLIGAALAMALGRFALGLY